MNDGFEKVRSKGLSLGDGSNQAARGDHTHEVDGTKAIWLRQNTPNAIPEGVWTRVNLDTLVAATPVGFYEYNLTTGVITTTEPGWYLIVAGFSLNIASGVVYGRICVDGIAYGGRVN
jgi:hypothetical protein